MSQVSVLIILLTAASPAPAGDGGGAKAQRAQVTIQAIEARPGNDRTEGVDPKLAEKLRRTLKLMGVAKPDLTSLGRSSRELGAGESTSMAVKPYEVEVTCKSVSADTVGVSVELFKLEKDPKTKKTEKKSKNRSSTDLTADEVHVVTVMQDAEKKTVFVISRERAGGE